MDLIGEIDHSVGKMAQNNSLEGILQRPDLIAQKGGLFNGYKLTTIRGERVDVGSDGCAIISLYIIY